MGETLTQQRRVEDEVPWDVNSFSIGTIMTVPEEEAPANSSCQQPR